MGGFYINNAENMQDTTLNSAVFIQKDKERHKVMEMRAVSFKFLTYDK